MNLSLRSTGGVGKLGAHTISIQTATLAGETFDGQAFTGSDAIEVVDSPKPDKKGKK